MEHLLPTETKPAECPCAYEAPQLLYDPLTGLYNKHGFITQGNRILQAITTKGCRAVLLYIEINDYDGLISRLGYDASLLLLGTMRDRLLAVFGKQALMGRFDSERFAILLPDGQLGIEETIRALEAPLRVGLSICHLSLSCGVAAFTNANDNMDMLIIAARSARREAQRVQRQVGWYAEEMRGRLARQRAIEDGLWFSRHGNGLSLVYQPKIDIRAGKVMGVEALLRWRHPELGAISPAEFIPIAERTRAILPIGEWLLHTALKQKHVWREDGQDIRMSINVSPLQLETGNEGPSVLETLVRECEHLDLRHETLEIEITEGLLSNADVMGQVRQIANAGFGIAVDDFGREHSALSLLVDCPATTLKIDKSFVDNVVENDRQLAVVHFIVDLARRLGMATVVEGIEHLNQLVALADAGCDYGQGYFYYRPLAPDQILDLRHRH